MQDFQLTPTTPANLCSGLFRNYLNSVAVSKRECDNGKRLEKSSIKTYASCVNCFINRIAKDRPLNKVLHPKFLKRVEQTDRNGGFRKRISMDRNGLKIFKEFYESHCKGKFPENQLYLNDPNMKIVIPETIVFRPGQTTEQVMLQRFRTQFLAFYTMDSNNLMKILEDYDRYRLQQVNYQFLKSNGLDMELILANTERLL